MTTKMTANKIVLSSLLVLGIAGLCAWPSFRAGAQKKGLKAQDKQVNTGDTTLSKPNANNRRIKINVLSTAALDSAMAALDAAQAQLKKEDFEKIQKEMEGAIKEINVEKIKAEVENGLKEVDMEKIKNDMAKAMKGMDTKKIKMEMEKALRDIDVEKIKREVAQSLKDIDLEKMQADIQKSLISIDFAEIEREVSNAKNINFKQIEEEIAAAKLQLDHQKINLKLQMKKADEDMKKAKQQIAVVRAGIVELEKDGLIQKGEKIQVEYKRGILFLNGKRQSKAISKKYKRYFDEGSFNKNSETDDEKGQMK